MKKISIDEFLRLRNLVFRSARPLDYTKWKFLFEKGSCDDFLSVLSGYQNEDGGFGHNIECNNWNPNSSPYTVCIALNIKEFDPATYPAWLPLSVFFIGSPESSFYPECRRTADMNLDTIVDSLRSMHEIHLPSAEGLNAYEQNNPHPDGKRWCVAEQTIGNYYWGSNFITRDLDILRKFGRLDFDLPVLIQ